MRRVGEALPADVEENLYASLRLCWYHSQDFDLTEFRSRLHDVQPVQPSLRSAFETLPTAELGILGRLPTELMCMILHELDVRSFFRFRQVNRRARALSTGLREYELVSKYGQEGLRGLMRAGLARCFTIRDLYRALTTDKCSSCGAFGGRLFLFTAERCCLWCLKHSASYSVLPPATVARRVGILPGRLRRLLIPTLRAVPGGIYNMFGTSPRRPKCLISEEMAAQTLLATGAVGEAAIRRLRDRTHWRDQPAYRFMAATAYPYYNLETAQLESAANCKVKGCQLPVEPDRDDSKDRD